MFSGHHRRGNADAHSARRTVFLVIILFHKKKQLTSSSWIFHVFAARDSLQITVNIGISLFSVSGDYFVCDIVSVVYHLKCLFIPRCCLIANKRLDQAWLISRAILIMIVIGKFSIVNACALWKRWESSFAIFASSMSFIFGDLLYRRDMTRS